MVWTCLKATMIRILSSCQRQPRPYWQLWQAASRVANAQGTAGPSHGRKRPTPQMGSWSVDSWSYGCYGEDWGRYGMMMVMMINSNHIIFPTNPLDIIALKGVKQVGETKTPRRRPRSMQRRSRHISTAHPLCNHDDSHSDAAKQIAAPTGWAKYYKD